MTRKSKLGKGLEALLNSTTTAVSFEPQPAERQQHEGLCSLPIEYLSPNPKQPRVHFEEDALNELAASIKTQGILQPILVRNRGIEFPQQYEIVAGERRWRAAQRLGLPEVPVIIKDISETSALALALIENIQREALNPLETAIALQRLHQEYGLTQQQIADSVGKSRVSVANMLRLLQLDPEVKDMLSQGEIEMGHARALVGLEVAQQQRIAQQIQSQRLNVRQAERLVQQLKKQSDPQQKQRDSTQGRLDIQILEQELSERFGTSVVIRHTASGTGQLKINYANLDVLDGILEQLR